MTTKNEVRFDSILRCLAHKVELITRYPDPNVREEIESGFNCSNCDSFQLCEQIEKTLKIS
jgi:hypothetical protein